MIRIPQELIEQFERGNVLLFVGERIVRDADGQATIDRLTARLVARCAVAGESERSFPEVAQDYEYERGRQALVQYLRDELQEMGDEPQRAHRLIAGLTGCDVLVTTCLDRRLEGAFAEAERPLDVVINDIDVVFEDQRKAQLYKLRGSVDRPESLVLTEEDYEFFFEDQASISVILQGYMARKTILFVGYDLADPHFKRLYRKVIAPLDKYARRAYAFGEMPPPRVCRWCKQHNVEVIGTDDTAFLKELTGQLATRAQPVSAAPPLPIVEPTAPLPERPYKLLDYYEAGDEVIFCGRQKETETLTSLIHAHRLVLLYGASGTGKTSLLLAGAVPRLERADPPYETLYVRALEDPALAIRRALHRRLPDADLPEGSELVDFLHAASGALGRPLVLLLDQFEEFFIRLSPEFRHSFISELGALYDARDVSVKVVISLREDWLASVDEIEKRIPDVFRTRMRLLSLTRDQARQAIAAPVERLGVSYEPALLERLLDDLASGGGKAVMPPQLQLVCSALYGGLEASQRTIALGAYERLGGARGVLRRYLDDELARLGGWEGTLARDALVELVTSQRTKAVKGADELALALGTGPADLEPVLEKLVRARLLRPVERADGVARAYELAHEYLIAEIVLSPEAVARKEAEELLRQGTENRTRFGTLLSADTFNLIDAQRERMRLDKAAQELMLRSALRHGRSVGHWLERVEDGERALALAEKVLLDPQGEAARRSLGTDAEGAGPERLRALAGRLHGAWRKARGAGRTAASDALWALRRHLPRGQRWRLVLARSPRAMRRTVLPLAGGVAAVLIVLLALWARPLWMPKPRFDDRDWVTIPAGEFTMGSDPTVDPEAGDGEQPQHTVDLDAYRIGRYEVTNEQYAYCVRATICDEPGGRIDESSLEKHPVVYVDWFNAKKFCEWIGGGLPTEAQWEKAARGTDGRIYPWGNDPPDCDRANFGSCVGSTTVVGSYPSGASPYEVLDMAGSVWEWTSSVYASYPYNPADGREDAASSGSRVVRGGSWLDDTRYARAAYRNLIGPDSTFDLVGFRCVFPISTRPGS